MSILLHHAYPTLAPRLSLSLFSVFCFLRYTGASSIDFLSVVVGLCLDFFVNLHVQFMDDFTLGLFWV